MPNTPAAAEQALIKTLNTDEMAEYLAMKTRILRVFEGDKIVPTDVRRHDGVVIFTVYNNDFFIVRGTLLELNRRALCFEKEGINNVTH